MAHKLKKNKNCKNCKIWYKNCLESLKYIKNEKLRDMLDSLFKILWLNNCNDFDIIWYEFCSKLGEK